LETQGQGDLRALLLETELMRAMDELIQRADHGRVEGLRALGATARLDLERFRRLVIIGQQIMPSPSPVLTAFLEALQLFVEAFDSSGGFRLLRIARPPILFYGLYGITSLPLAERRLLDIILQRNLLADRLDCFLQCGCTQEAVICQVLLDKILYDMDRAIDLYALGTHEFGDGPPERRARAYGHVIEVFLNLHRQPIPVPEREPLNLNCLNVNNVLTVSLGNILIELHDLLLSATPDAVRQQELCMQMVMQQRWQNLVTTMAPACTEFNLVFRATEEVIQRAIRAVGGDPAACLNEFNIRLPDPYEVSLENI
jgi:hypothetical protein